MTGPYLLGVDIGTLTTKGVIVDLSGRIMAEQTLEHEISQPKVGWAEQDAEQWWQEFCKITNILLAKTHFAADEIFAVCISGSFPNVCLVDELGKPIRNAILYCDNRSTSELNEIHEQTGISLMTVHATPKIMWLIKNEFHNFAKTHVILTTNGFVVHRLTGKFVVDYPNALAFGAIFDPSNLRWDELTCEKLGIPLEVLPKTVQATDIVGTVTEEASKHTGLSTNTLVLAGTGDTYLSMLGSGVLEKGEAMIYYGTAGLLLINNCELEKFLSRIQQCETRENPIIYATNVFTTGSLLKWFRDHFCPYELDVQKKLGINAYHLLDEQAERIKEGSEGIIILPYFMGQRTPEFNPLARGIIFGLTTAHTRIHIYRAILECFGYAVLDGISTFRNELKIKRIVAAGGGAKSKLWRQIVTDIVNLPQEYVPEGEAALGDAFLAGYGAGLFKEFRVFKNSWLRVADVTYPKAHVHLEYKKLYSVYRHLHKDLREKYEELARALSTNYNT